MSPDAAPTPIRVAHSILDAADLAGACARRYDLPPGLRARLISHGQNDWYALDGGGGHWALRVLKACSRSPAQLLSELDWQRRLGADFPVPAPLALRDGTLAFGIAAPEGERWTCLYPWVPGRTLGADLGTADAFDAGQLLGRLHRHAAQLTPGARRHDLADKLARTAPALDASLQDDDDRRLVAEARRAALAALDHAPGLPQGSLHGDLHFGNLRRDDSGRLWLLDFDDCGTGPLSVDLTAFAWRNRCERLPAALDAAFMEGYQACRALTGAERAALPGLQLARALYLAGVFARDRDILGKVPGFDRPWPHYLALVREALHTV